MNAAHGPRGRLLITSEAGLAGHPDKVADQIGDAVLDAFLEADPAARVGCQVMLANGTVMVGGQITSTGSVDIAAVTRSVLGGIGYAAESEGLSPDSEILVRVTPQSRQIADGVDRGGAGDSAIIIGCACRDTPEFMPISASCAHRIAEALDTHRKERTVSWLRPDGKIQVTAEYLNRAFVSLQSIIVSVEYDSISSSLLHPFLQSVVREAVRPAALDGTMLLPDGFRVGGPKADCGLSGRKVIADTYGGFARHGGGGLSGKDPTKIDRCGMYAARYIAKNLVAAGVTDECEIELAYMIGRPDPVAISVACPKGARLPEDEIIRVIQRVFPLRPSDIIERLQLRRPIYKRTSVYGHFGRTDPEFTWERCDLISEIERFL